MQPAQSHQCLGSQDGSAEGVSGGFEVQGKIDSGAQSVAERAHELTRELVHVKWRGDFAD